MAVESHSLTHGAVGYAEWIAEPSNLAIPTHVPVPTRGVAGDDVDQKAVADLLRPRRVPAEVTSLIRRAPAESVRTPARRAYNRMSPPPRLMGGAAHALA